MQHFDTFWRGIPLGDPSRYIHCPEPAFPEDLDAFGPGTATESQSLAVRRRRLFILRPTWRQFRLVRPLRHWTAEWNWHGSQMCNGQPTRVISLKINWLSNLTVVCWQIKLLDRYGSSESSSQPQRLRRFTLPLQRRNCPVSSKRIRRRTLQVQFCNYRHVLRIDQERHFVVASTHWWQSEVRRWLFIHLKIE